MKGYGLGAWVSGYVARIIHSDVAASLSRSFLLAQMEGKIVRTALLLLLLH